MMTAEREGSSLNAGFEAVLADVGARLLSAPLDAVDAAITDALSRLVPFLGVERSTVRLIDPNSVARASHSRSKGPKPRPVSQMRCRIPPSM